MSDIGEACGTCGGYDRHKKDCPHIVKIKDQKPCCEGMKYLLRYNYLEHNEYCTYWYIKGQTVILFPNEESIIPKCCPICGSRINKGIRERK